MINPDYARFIGNRLTRRFESQGHNVRGHWDEKRKEYSFLFMDGTDFSFKFQRDGEKTIFLILINPMESRRESLEDFVREYVERDDVFLSQFPTKKKKILKYKQRLRLEKVEIRDGVCQLVYGFTDRMPNNNESINETIDYYILRRALFFSRFRKK